MKKFLFFCSLFLLPSLSFASSLCSRDMMQENRLYILEDFIENCTNNAEPTHSVASFQGILSHYETQKENNSHQKNALQKKRYREALLQIKKYETHFASYMKEKRLNEEPLAEAENSITQEITPLSSQNEDEFSFVSEPEKQEKQSVKKPKILAPRAQRQALQYEKLISLYKNRGKAFEALVLRFQQQLQELRGEDEEDISLISEERQQDLVEEFASASIVFHTVSFPNLWKREDISVKGLIPNAIEGERVKKILTEEMQKYPISVLKNNLKKVYILSYLEFYGVEYAGTNSKDTVYIVTKEGELGYTDTFLRKTFHHEFSSILLRNHSKLFPRERWSFYTELEYGKGGSEFLKNNEHLSLDAHNFTPEYNRKGFINSYGTASLEEDINRFAEYLFVPNDEYENVVQMYDNIRAKSEILKDFYNALDPRF
jgi:hypothetical protein